MDCKFPYKKIHKILVLILHLYYFHQKKLIWTAANEAFWVQLYLKLFKRKKTPNPPKGFKQNIYRNTFHITKHFLLHWIFTSVRKSWRKNNKPSTQQAEALGVEKGSPTSSLLGSDHPALPRNQIINNNLYKEAAVNNSFPKSCPSLLTNCNQWIITQGSGMNVLCTEGQTQPK